MKLKELLVEAVQLDPGSLSGEEFANILAKAYYNDWLREKEKFGDDYPKTNDFSEYLIGGLQYDMETGFQYGHPDFIYNTLKKGNITDGLIDLQPENCAFYQHGCFYNALDFILRTDREDVSLAYGFFVHSFFDYLSESESTIEGYTKYFDMSKHSFIVTDDERIFDPTLPHEEITDEYYVWETVPESVYEDFHHEFNDDNYNAREFGDYIDRQIQAYKGSMNLKDRIRRVHRNHET